MIELRNVSKSYRVGDETVHPLKHIHLTIAEGEFVAIIGPSGSGKTTLLNLIGGLEQPTSGSLMVCGQDLAQLKDGRLSVYRTTTLGYIFQTFNLLPRLTVFKNVTVPAMLARTNRTAREQAATEALAAVGLTKKKDYLPNKLSGGERQRVAIARALMNNPSVILADEPTGNLDEKNARAIMDMLINLCKERHKTLILVTHNPDLARLADRVIELRDGEITKGRA